MHVAPRAPCHTLFGSMPQGLGGRRRRWDTRGLWLHRAPSRRVCARLRHRCRCRRRRCGCPRHRLRVRVCQSAPPPLVSVIVPSQAITTRLPPLPRALATAARKWLSAQVETVKSAAPTRAGGTDAEQRETHAHDRHPHSPLIPFGTMLTQVQQKPSRDGVARRRGG